MTADKSTPLRFETTHEFRAHLDGLWLEGGLDAVTRYVTEELRPGRVLEIGDVTPVLFAVQLRHLSDGEPGDIVTQYHRDVTPENSRLALSVVLPDFDPALQLTVRRELQ